MIRIRKMFEENLFNDLIDYKKIKTFQSKFQLNFNWKKNYNENSEKILIINSIICEIL